ncbi:MAG: hypothetical protein WBE08_12405 [Methyloceanibacter sp.]|jgi:hypothetical protein
MFPLTRFQLLKFAAVGAIVALTVASSPARANEIIQHLGPVGPNEPILTGVGQDRVIAFYVPHGQRCAVHAVVWDDGHEETASRLRVNLSPGQITHIDSTNNKSLDLRCADGTLAIVKISESILFGLDEDLGQ